MYTIVDRRTINRERLKETVEQAQREFFPKLQAASGFVGFYLVADEAHSINTAILVFESKANADAFEKENSGWMQTLESHGHTLQSENRGETVIQLEPKK